MSLEEIIIQKIKLDGPISFRDFMEMALYHPDLGYYTAGRDKIGPQGDFFTSSSYTSLFGKLLARQLEEMCEKLEPSQFTVVEYGAGTGMLCHDILRELQRRPEIYNKLHYCIIEKSCLMREKEKEILGDAVTWHDNIKDIGKFSGCVLSNELVDNFSVHEVIMRENLMEVFVDYENGFIEILRPARQELVDYLKELNVRLPKGFRTEINLEIIRWTEEIAACLNKGFFVTIDYGFPSAEFYSHRRSEGTIVCYHKHTINYCPYINIGEQDITAHVNFSALNHWAQKNGFHLNGLTSQAQFLLGLGLANELSTLERPSQPTAFIQNFLLDMGKKLKVLVQQKGMEAMRLSGLQFPMQMV
jgi:SAM-dependent MidA family methyltransferase